MLFDGKREHESRPFEGGVYRCSIVFFCHSCWRTYYYDGEQTSIDRGFLHNSCGYVFPPAPNPLPVRKVKPLPASSGAGGSDQTGGESEDDVLERGVVSKNEIKAAAARSVTAASKIKGVASDNFNIFVSTGEKTLCLQVTWNDTVGTLKAMIQAKEYIERDEQELKFKSVKLEDNYNLWHYGIAPGVTPQLGKLPGGGKRAAAQAVDAGGREDKDTKLSNLTREIVANMMMLQHSGNPATVTVRNRILQLQQKSTELEHDELFEHLYEGMSEPQMLKLREKYEASGRNTNQRYTAIARSIFEQQFKMIEDTKREMGILAKMLNDCATLTMVTQYSNDEGLVKWEDFQKTLNKTTTEKSREVGAAGRGE